MQHSTVNNLKNNWSVSILKLLVNAELLKLFPDSELQEYEQNSTRRWLKILQILHIHFQLFHH